MGLGKFIKNAMRQCSSSITKPFTRSARHTIEDEFKIALNNCYQQEQEALQKLYLQRQEERNKVKLQKETLEEALKNNADQLLQEKKKLSEYFAEKDKAFKEAFETIRNNFESFRAGLRACEYGKEEIEIVNAILQKSETLKRQFLSFNPLHFAADNNQVKIIQLLCQHGADVHQRNSHYGCTALDIAEERGQVEACTALKAIIKETENLWKEIEAEDYAAIKNSLGKGAAINATFPAGYNILQKVIMDKKSYNLICFLVDAGADCYHEGPKLPKEAAELAASPPNISNNAIALAGYYPDWRLKDYLIDKLGIEDKNLEVECTEKHSASNIAKHLPNAIKASDSRNSNRCSAFITHLNKKEFFSVSGDGIFSLVVYDCTEKQWRKGLFWSGPGIPNKDSKNSKMHEHWVRELLLQKSHITSSQPIQLLNVKTLQGKERLYLLTLEDNRNIILWRYKPESRKWNVSKFGPTLDKEFTLIDMEIYTTQNNALFLTVTMESKRQTYLKIWSYDPSRNKWVQYKNEFEHIASHPQILTIKTETKKTSVFLLIERFTDESLKERKYELWRLDPNICFWSPQQDIPWSNVSKSSRHIQMRAVKIAGETHLYFFYRFATGTQLWSYNPKCKLWQRHPGETSWPLLDAWSPTSERGIVQMHIVSGHKENSDILLFLRLSKNGIECQSYHPLSSKWSSLKIPVSNTEGLQLREDFQKVQMHVELVQNQYHLVIFNASEDLGKKPKVQTWTYAFNIRDLEKRLTENFPRTAITPTFSLAELNKMRLFVSKIFEASHSLLAAARAGDWPSVFASLEQGADVYATGSEGYNALQLALRHPLDLSTLKRLLQAGISINHRANLQNKSTLELARDSNLIDVHDYIASLLEKPAMRLTPETSIQFNKVYQNRIEEAQAFLNKRDNNISKCQTILSYYRLIPRTNPYAIYVWPGMLMLGEILTFFPSILKKNDRHLKNIQDFFVKTYAFHKAICSVGIDHYDVLRKKPIFAESDWTYVINGIVLREAAESYAKEHGLSATSEEVQKIIFGKYEKLVLQGITSALTEFSKTMAKVSVQNQWIKEAAEWITKNLQHSPFQLREYYKDYLQQHLDSSASVAKEASQAGIILLPEKLNVESEIKVMNEQEAIINKKLKSAEQDFIKEKEELELWLAKREQECIKCLQEINTFLKENQKNSEQIEAQFDLAIADLNNQFAHFRNVLAQNKEDALRKVQKQAFKSLVIMAAACAAAYMLAPLLVSALGGAASAGLSTQTVTILESVLRGSIMGGINGGFARQNILEATLKGAGFSFVGSFLGDFTNKMIDPSLSEVHRAIHVALPIGMETAIRTQVAGGKIGENIIGAVGAGLLVDRTVFSSTISEGFMYDLRDNLLKSFIGGGINSFISKQHFGSTVASAGITGIINMGSESIGKKVGSTFLPEKVAIPECQQFQQTPKASETKGKTAPHKKPPTTAKGKTAPQKPPSKAQGKTTPHKKQPPKVQKAPKTPKAPNAPKLASSTPLKNKSIPSKSDQPSGLMDQFLSESRAQLSQHSAHFPQPKQAGSVFDSFIQPAFAHTSTPSAKPKVSPLLFSKTNASAADSRLQQKQPGLGKQNVQAAETILSRKGRFAETFPSIHNVQSTQDIINFRTVGVLPLAAQHFPSNFSNRRNSKMPIYSAKKGYWDNFLGNQDSPQSYHNFIYNNRNSYSSRWSFSMPSCLPETHDNPYLCTAIKIGRGIEVSRDATVEALLNITDTVKSLPVFVWDMSGAASQVVFGKCTEGSIIRNRERWTAVTTFFENFKTADFSSQVGMGAQAASGLIFGAAIGGMGCGVFPTKSRLTHKSSYLNVNEQMSARFIPNEKIPLTKQRIIDYLDNISEIPRENLFRDIKSIGLKYAEGSGDGRFSKFTHKNKDIRIEIHAPHLKSKNGAKYDHIHIYDKSGNSLDINLRKVKFNTPEAHIRIQENPRSTLEKTP